jgi:hypothetical protein
MLLGHQLKPGRAGQDFAQVGVGQATARYGGSPPAASLGKLWSSGLPNHLAACLKRAFDVLVVDY